MAVTSIESENADLIVGTVLAASWPLWLPVGLALGIALYFSLTFEPPLYAGALAAVAALPLMRLWRMAAITLLAVSIGFTAAQMRTLRVAAPVLAKEIRGTDVTGRVVVNEARAQGRRLLLDDVRITGLAAPDTPARVRITLRGDGATEIRPGERVRLRAALSPPSEPAMPGAFDFSRQAFFKGIGAFGFAYGAPRLLDPPATANGWRMTVGRIRQAVTARIRASLDGEAGAVAAALLTGERGAISKSTLAAMRDAGLAHLLAISGLHMGLFAGILFFVVRALLAAWEPVALRYPIKKWAALAALAGMAFYLLLSGATIPTQRAFLMGSLVIAAVLLDRTAISMRSVAWAAAVVLLVQPESLLGASFQMSFAAVIALVAAFEGGGDRLRAAIKGDGMVARLIRYGVGVSLVTVIATLATGPFAAYNFNRIAVYGLAANLIAVPLTALWIMPWGIAVLLLMPFGLEAWALAPMGWGIDGLIAVAQTVAAWPHAVALLPAMPTAGLALAVGGGLWLCLWRGPRRWLGAPLFAAALLSPALATLPDVLVNRDAKLFAVRAPSGELVLSSRKTARFAGKIWLRRDGQDTSASWPKDGSTAWLRCDDVGCIYRGGGPLVALVRDGRALAEDCRVVDVVVSAVPVRKPCPAPSLVIDRYDLWRNGAHALYFDDRGSVRVESVGDQRGARPWAPRRGTGES